MSTWRQETAARDISRMATGVSGLAGTIADRRRVAILLWLRRSPATVAEISVRVGIPPSKASLQLGRLRKEHWVRVQASGRHRLYSVDTDRVSDLLDPLLTVAERPGGMTLPSPRTRPPRRPEGLNLQLARVCYDHLAGLAGVDLATRMERSGWILCGRRAFVVTRLGEIELARRGVDVDVCREIRRKFAPGCLDWTEGQLHIGGSLGAAILKSLISAGFLAPGSGRAYRVVRPLGHWLRAR